MIHYRINKETMGQLSECFRKLAETKEERNTDLSCECCKENAIEKEKKDG